MLVRLIWVMEKSVVLKELVKKEFLKGYWNLYVVRIFHYIIEHYAQQNNRKRRELRVKLLGNYLEEREALNAFFLPNKEISEKFSLDEELSRADILDPRNPSSEYPLFGKWFSSLEQIVYGIIRRAMDSPEWKNFNHYFHIFLVF